MWPSAHQRVPRALQGRVRVPRALHGHEGRPTRLAPAPRALGARAMSDDEQTLRRSPGGVARVPAGTGDAGAGGEPDALGVRAPPLRLFSIADHVVRPGGLHSCDVARADRGWSARPARRRGRP